MHTSRRWSRIAAIAGVIAHVVFAGHAPAAPAGATIVPQLQNQLGLNEAQVRGALGALLVFAREKLPEPEFKDLAQDIPNAAQIMQDVKLRGIVTRPIDDIDDYETALSSLGIGQPPAAQFAPAVLDALTAAGLDRERDILARVVE